VLGESSGRTGAGNDIPEKQVGVAVHAAPCAWFKTMNLAGVVQSCRSIVGTWDYVMALGFFQYLSPDNAVGLFREALRVARGGC